MKKILVLVFAFSLFAFHSSKAQTYDPAHWSYAVNDLGNGEYEIAITCTLDPGWHIFSKDYNGISVPASLTLEKNDSYETVGELREEGEKLQKEIKIGDDTELSIYYEGKVVFYQKVKILKKDAVVKGSMEYMTCKEVCVAPTTFDFTVELKTK